MLHKTNFLTATDKNGHGRNNIGCRNKIHQKIHQLTGEGGTAPRPLLGSAPVWTWCARGRLGATTYGTTLMSGKRLASHH